MHPFEVDAVLGALAAIFRGEPRDAAQRTAEALVTTPAPGAIGPRPACSFDDEIRRVLATSDVPAAAAILAAQQFLPWGTNPVAGRMTDDAASICAVAEILGPEGPIPAPDLRAGLLFQRADTYYPLHNHLAEETYVILAGRALWTAGEDVRMRSAGALIHHPRLMAHAFRAGPEGFVALYRWSGDIGPQSYTFLEDPALRAG
ncbi:MAG: hypothetical protein H6895_01650 [Defluviimonas sp.]|uniref:dimethylsulfonioproprionate lyase family protein n=1 Tax=Albidovulum sp. TaxID=1872424 RepID=UPI002A262494|nr:hypothetical protein [Defluviimonas sp.]